MKAIKTVLVTVLLAGIVFLNCGSPALAEYADPLSKEANVGLNKTIFLDLRDINVVDIFKFLAIQGNLNIVTSKNVQGRSTLLLRNVTIGDALDIIVISNQLAYEIKNGIIYIMTEDEYAQTNGKNYNDKKKILTRTLRYAKPSYVLTALQSIQSALGKVIVDEDTGTVIMIDTNEKLIQMNALLDEVEKKLDTKVIELQYANAKEVEAQLRPQLDGKAVGSVFGDPRSNQVVVSGYPGRLEDIVPLVHALDKKTDAVLIEARILQLTINPRFDFGIDWEKTFQHTGHGALKELDLHSSFPINQNVSSAANLGSVGRIFVGDIDDEEFEIDLKALKQIENTKVLANPRLMILNRQEAKINIGDRIPYVVTTSTGTGNNVSVSEEIKFIDVGIILVVTPIINDNGFITMKIRPEISSRTGTLTTPTNNEIPLVNTTFVESTVIVQDGVTIILGGLRRDELTENNSGVPFLMDIPFLGHAFQSRRESSRKTEIVILITPRIVSGDQPVVDKPIDIKGDPTRVESSKNLFDSSRFQRTFAPGEPVMSQSDSETDPAFKADPAIWGEPSSIPRAAK